MPVVRRPWPHALSVLAVLLGGCAAVATDTPPQGRVPAAPDPSNATYQIEGREVSLSSGAASRPAAPGAASQLRTRIFGPAARGDLDGDGDEDAVVWLSQTAGGSGHFYYVAAALNAAGRYRGSAAVWIGDRIAPQTLEIRNGVVMANYADRRPGQAMALPPGAGKTAHLIWRGDRLAMLPPLAERELLIQGWLAIGHEVRVFRPCGDGPELWLLGHSPALAELVSAHRAAVAEATPYAALFVTLTGRPVAAPNGGFGAGYAGGFLATRLVQPWRGGDCRH